MEQAAPGHKLRNIGSTRQFNKIIRKINKISNMIIGFPYGNHMKQYFQKLLKSSFETA